MSFENLNSMVINISIAFGVLLFLILLLIPPYKAPRPNIAQPNRQPERQHEEQKVTEKPISSKLNSSAISDAIAGLVSLGYKKLDAKERVQKAWELSRSDDAATLIKKAMTI